MDDHGGSTSIDDTKVHEKVRHRAADASCDSMTVRRLQKIEQYQRESMDNASAEHTVLAAANGGLLRMGLHLEENLNRRLEKLSDLPDPSERVRPTIETHLKLMRQVERLSRLGLDLRNETTKQAWRSRRVAEEG